MSSSAGGADSSIGAAVPPPRKQDRLGRAVHDAADALPSGGRASTVSVPLPVDAVEVAPVAPPEMRDAREMIDAVDALERAVDRSARSAIDPRTIFDRRRSPCRRRRDVEHAHVVAARRRSASTRCRPTKPQPPVTSDTRHSGRCDRASDGGRLAPTPIAIMKEGSTISETISTKRIERPSSTPMLKRPRCSATASVAKAATVLSCATSTASGVEVSSTCMPSSCVPALSLHHLMRAHHDVDAARHAEADQQRDDDDVGEVERQVESRPRRRPSTSAATPSGASTRSTSDEPPPDEHDDEADRDDGVERSLRRRTRRIASPAPVTLAGAPAALGATACTLSVKVSHRGGRADIAVRQHAQPHPAVRRDPFLAQLRRECRRCVTGSVTENFARRSATIAGISRVSASPSSCSTAGSVPRFCLESRQRIGERLPGGDDRRIDRIVCRRRGDRRRRSP